MRVPVFMIDVFAIAFMDPTLPFKVTSGLISRRSPLLLFFSTLIFSVLFVVISAHEAH